MNNRHDTQSLQEAVRWKEIWFDDLGISERTEVQLSLSDYLDAEEYDALFARFEAAGLKPPKNLRQIKAEGTMAYAMARQRLGLEYSEDEIRAGLESFLKRNTADWLARGLGSTTARWMKLAFWRPGDHPIATLLKCYDLLPGLTPPEYPPVARLSTEDHS